MKRLSFLSKIALRRGNWCSNTSAAAAALQHPHAAYHSSRIVRVPSATNLSFTLITQHFLQGFNDGSKERSEPFLHHDFMFEQMPAPGCPKGAQLYKFDFLKRLPDFASAFSSRVVEVTRMVEQGNFVIVESKQTAVANMDLGPTFKKGQQQVVFSTTWYEFDPATKMIVKIKAYDCVGPAEDTKK